MRSVCPGSAVPCVKVAPNLAYSTAYNLTTAHVRSLVAGGAAQLLLLSAQSTYNSDDPRCAWNPGPFNGINCAARQGPDPGGALGGGGFAGPTEGAPLVTLNAAGRSQLREWAGLEDATLVLDAQPASQGAAGRAAELADVVLTLQ